MLIYKATNIVTGKSYIGQTQSHFNTRKWSHYYHALDEKDSRRISILYNAIKKYGKDKFVWEILEDNINDKNVLNERETFNILKYDSYMTNGYNMTLGGEGNTGFRHSEKAKRKMSFDRKGEKSSWWGRKHTKEEIEKIKGNKAFSNHHHNEDSKKSISQSLKKSYKTGKRKHHLLGKKQSEETKRKISESLKKSHKERKIK